MWKARSKEKLGMNINQVQYRGNQERWEGQKRGCVWREGNKIEKHHMLA
jgi:hypothetical protein